MSLLLRSIVTACSSLGNETHGHSPRWAQCSPLQSSIEPTQEPWPGAFRQESANTAIQLHHLSTAWVLPCAAASCALWIFNEPWKSLRQRRANHRNEGQKVFQKHPSEAGILELTLLTEGWANTAATRDEPSSGRWLLNDLNNVSSKERLPEGNVCSPLLMICGIQTQTMTSKSRVTGIFLSALYTQWKPHLWFSWPIKVANNK